MLRAVYSMFGEAVVRTRGSLWQYLRVGGARNKRTVFVN